jgi:hypothetical protein
VPNLQHPSLLDDDGDDDGDGERGERRGWCEGIDVRFCSNPRRASVALRAAGRAAPLRRRSSQPAPPSVAELARGYFSWLTALLDDDEVNAL